jgi:hypothetical protein
MPCNSDYMEATGREISLSHVACLLDELSGRAFTSSCWAGYHPAVYNKHVSKEDANRMVAELCRRIQTVEIKNYSLEMQIWWRDHKAADKARHEKEMSEKKNERARNAAIAKLTPKERELLGASNE